MVEEKKNIVEEFKNQAGSDNEVGVTDQIGIDMLKKQVKDIYDEIEAFKGGLDNAKKSFDNYKEQADVEHRLQDLQLDHFGMIEEQKTHLIHNVPEFWELQKKKFEFEVRSQRMQDKSQLEGYEAEIKRAEERLKQLDVQLAKKITKLEEMGEEVPANPYDEE